MPDKYSDLYSLIDQDHEANSYFSALPYYVKQSISYRSQNINSFNSLRDYAENLLRDDE
ncbi:MAG TPA: hypothetical protein VHP54_04010 [Caproiciproducens sp.]|nr:hypothetical protein [Caproiciproducens sp.]